MSGLDWRARHDTIVTACQECSAGQGSVWLRRFRTTALRHFAEEDLTVTVAGCMRVCPGEGAVAVVVRLADGRTLETAVRPDDTQDDRLISDLEALLQPAASGQQER